MAGGFQRKSPEKLPTSAFRIRAWFRYVLQAYCQEIQLTTQPSTMMDWVEFAGWLHEHVAWQKNPVDHTTAIGWFNGTHPPGAKANPALADAFPHGARVLNDKDDFGELLNILFGALDLHDASEYQRVISEAFKSPDFHGDIESQNLLLRNLAPISQGYVASAILFITKLRATVFGISLYHASTDDLWYEKLALLLERLPGMRYLTLIGDEVGGAVTADRVFVDLTDVGCSFVRKGRVSNFLAYSLAAACISLMLLRLHNKNMAPLGNGRTKSERLLDVAITCIFPVPTKKAVTRMDTYNLISRDIPGLSDAVSRRIAALFIRVRTILSVNLLQYGSTLQQVTQMLWDSKQAVAQVAAVVEVFKNENTLEDDETEGEKMAWIPPTT